MDRPDARALFYSHPCHYVSEVMSSTAGGGVLLLPGTLQLDCQYVERASIPSIVGFVFEPSSRARP
jgi:hypothetical protein